MKYPPFVITVIAPWPQMGEQLALQALLKEMAISIVDVRDRAIPKTLADRRSARSYTLSGAINPTELRQALNTLVEQENIDYLLQPLDIRQIDYKLAVFDMDSTLIQCELIDQLAIHANVGDQIAAITERTMRGELDFNTSFTERLGMLAGLSESVLADIAANLPITDGMPELISTLRARGIRTAILSGGFSYFAQSLQDRFGFDEYHTNTLEVIDGKITGRVVTDIVDGTRKKFFLEQIAANMKISHSQVIAVGDGANDLLMLKAAGLGIAFKAKPMVREQSSYNIHYAGLDGVLYLLESPSELNDN